MTETNNNGEEAMSKKIGKPFAKMIQESLSSPVVWAAMQQYKEPGKPVRLVVEARFTDRYSGEEEAMKWCRQHGGSNDTFR